jgi:mRNA-degrading endonuclease toxin of MazEF toxin-antitoxin module
LGEITFFNKISGKIKIPPKYILGGFFMKNDEIIRKYRLREPDESFDIRVDQAIKRQQTIQLKGLKAQLEWIKRQIEYLTFAENHESYFELHRGEVYEFDWGVNVGSEFSSRHYGVVLANSGKTNPLVIVCPLKTNRYGGNPYSDVNLGYITSIISDSETLAVVNQVRSLDKLRMYVRPIIHETIKSNEGKIILSDEQMSLIENGLRKVFKLNK